MEKKRFKMYKAGKSWIVAPIVFFGLVGLVSIKDTQQVYADELIQSEMSELDNQNEESKAAIIQEEPKNQESIEEVPTIEDTATKELSAPVGNDQINSEESIEADNPTIDDTNSDVNTNSEEIIEDDSEKNTQIDENHEKNSVPEKPIESTTDTKNSEIGSNSQPKETESSTETSKTRVSTTVQTSTDNTPEKKVTTKKDSVPIYRVYNPNSGEHLHTMNGNEKNYLVRLGWRDEGISMYVDGTGNQLFRLYNPNSGEHFYSATRSAISA